MTLIETYGLILVFSIELLVLYSWYLKVKFNLNILENFF